MNIHKDFFSVFKKREFAALQGAGRRNLFVLILIFWGTSMAIGFSNGSLLYLAKKMDSPFVRWVDLIVPYTQQDRIHRIMDDLQNDSINEHYGIENVTGYHRFPMNFWNPEARGTFTPVGRTIDLEDNVLQAVFDADNLIAGRPFIDDDDYGFIVTEAFLKDLGYDHNSLFIYWSERLGDDTQVRIPLPVIAVVNELPGMHRFAVTPRTYSRFSYRDRLAHPFMPVDESSLFLYFLGSHDEATSLAGSIQDELNDSDEFIYVSAHVNQNNDTHQEGYLLQLSFFPEVSGYTAMQDLYENIMDFPLMGDYQDRLVRYHNFRSRLYSQDRLAPYDNISVSFSSLSKIRDFSQWLASLEHGLEMDIAQVEAKENYDFISKLTIIISFVLIVFSVYAAGLFLKSVLRMHLEKIKMNLGTFLAFGLQYKTIQRTYLEITFRFVLTALVAGLLTSFIIGEAGGIRMVFRILDAGLEPGETYFEQFNYLTALSAAMILIYSYYIVKNALKNQLTKTPGDLIYERG